MTRLQDSKENYVFFNFCFHLGSLGFDFLVKFVVPRPQKQICITTHKVLFDG